LISWRDKEAPMLTSGVMCPKKRRRGCSRTSLKATEGRSRQKRSSTKKARLQRRCLRQIDHL
tara:strand:- start:39 stop:224 length:186 start_codon:yes stop_codon:yes gene_type:complete